MPQFIIPEDVMFRDLEGEVILIHLGTGIYFGLDTVGSRIWQLLAEHGDQEKVIQAMLREFDVKEADLRRDVDVLIEKLTEKKLLVRPQKAS